MDMIENRQSGESKKILPIIVTDLFHVYAVTLKLCTTVTRYIIGTISDIKFCS